MIKLTFCLTRLPSYSREEFQDYWRNQHAPKVVAAKEALAIRRYVQCHTFGSLAAEGGAAARGIPMGDNIGDFDGVAELWWDSEEALAMASATEDGKKHGAILLEDEATFIDLARCRIFMTEETEVIAA